MAATISLQHASDILWSPLSSVLQNYRRDYPEYDWTFEMSHDLLSDGVQATVVVMSNGSGNGEFLREREQYGIREVVLTRHDLEISRGTAINVAYEEVVNMFSEIVKQIKSARQLLSLTDYEEAIEAQDAMAKVEREL